MRTTNYDELRRIRNYEKCTNSHWSFCKAKYIYQAQPVPYALKKKLEDEMSRLVKLGIYEAIPISQWAGLYIVTNHGQNILGKL